jgi:peptidoglycan/xylan/chitin deacetylase (PgdA/CDA1 family)
MEKKKMILAYHRVNPWHKKDALTVSPENFERHIKYLIEKKFKQFSPEKYFSNYSSSDIVHSLFLVTFDDGYADNLWYALPVLKKFGIKPLIFLTVNYVGTEDIFKRYRDKGKDRFLNWQEVKEMSADDVIFGSHSLSHPHLPVVDKEKLWAEVAESKKILEDKTGKEVDFFCYPYGDFDQRVIESVQKAGYKGAFVTPGIKRKIKKSIYTLTRTGVYGHNDFLTFRIKIWKDYLIERYF